jgi:(2Fe-2S) ferredoxin
MTKSKQITKFAIAGKFIGFTLKDDDRIKEIQLQTYKGDVWIKPSKQLRLTLKNTLSIGDMVMVEGEKHSNGKKGQIEFKANLVTIKQPANAIASTQNLTTRASDRHSTATILEETLRDRGLESQITIKKVGCIKHCKSGPHVVLMPDKTRYSAVKPSRIPELIERHFPLPKHPQSA